MTAAKGKPPYDIHEHRHRFAVWAASRAAQRGLKGGHNVELGRALEACGVALVVRTPSSWPGTAKAFDAAHLRWCRSIVAALSASGTPHATFGRAAKLVAVYLKTMIVIAGYHDTPFGCILHPPIDGILLRHLASDSQFDGQLRRRWKRTRWTQLDEPSYASLVGEFRRVKLDQPAFWAIERNWRSDSR
jgi:hypothetical protein